MILALDAGNTNICVGCVDTNGPLMTARIATDRMKTEDEYAVILGSILQMNHIPLEEISGAIICSVVPPVNRMLMLAAEMVIGKTPILIRPGIRTGLKLLVTAGATQEAIDPVRYITNHSSGKMGYAIAKAAMLRGAEVTLVSGRTALTPSPFVHTVDVVSAADMYREVTARAPEQDIIIKAAAVADYTPAEVADEKIKKKDGDLSIPLTRTQDILGYLGAHRVPGQVLCGFSMETEHMLENSRKKLEKKNVDLIAANNVKVAGAGFQGDTNVLTLITRENEVELPLMSKEQAAHQLLNKLLEIRLELGHKGEIDDDD